MLELKAKSVDGEIITFEFTQIGEIFEPDGVFYVKEDFGISVCYLESVEPVK